MNVLPFTEDIPLEVIAFLDPTIEKLCFEQTEGKTFIHLKFKDEEEIILNNPADLEQYLSSGTIKGIITFSMVKEVLHSGGYLLVDEIENHFNKEIVTTLMRFFMDSRLNKMAERLFSLRIIRNCWTNMTEMTEFVSLETVMALQQKSELYIET